MSLCFVVLVVLGFSLCACLPAGLSSGSVHNKIQKRVIADTISKIFDLPMASSGHNRKQAPPEYMVELYNRVALPNGLPRGDGEIPHGAKVIRSFELSATSDVDSTDVAKGTGIFFNVSGVSSRESVLEAELHLFKLKTSDSLGHKLFKVHVYEVLDENKLGDPSAQRRLDMQMVLAHGTSRWTVFKVGRAVQDWVSGLHPNHGLLVIATTMKGLPIPLHLGYRHNKLPLLVLYDSEGKELENEKLVVPDSVLLQASEIFNSSSRTKREIPEASCTKQDLYLNFEDLGLERIVNPTVYNAYWCEGRCTFPLGQEVAPTNHASVQSIAHFLGLGGAGIGEPCCAPSTLLSVSILYFDENGNSVLKQNDDMVVGECACQ